MPTYRKYKSRDGSTTFTATVRIAGFAPAAKTFPTRKAAADWAATEELLREQRKSASGVRRDVAVLMVGDLLLEFLADPETMKLRTFDDLHRLCAWWRDIDLAKQTLRIRIAKNDEPRTVHVPKAACDALKVLQGEKVCALSGAVFTMVSGARLKSPRLNRGGARSATRRDSMTLGGTTCDTAAHAFWRRTTRRCCKSPSSLATSRSP